MNKSGEMVSKLKTDENLVWRVMNDQACIIHLNSGFYYNLSPVGTAIWLCLKEGKYSIPEISADIQRRFDCSNQEQIDQDIARFVKTLEKEKILHLEALTQSTADAMKAMVVPPPSTLEKPEQEEKTEQEGQELPPILDDEQKLYEAPFIRKNRRVRVPVANPTFTST
jgi:hypothetical protein